MPRGSRKRMSPGLSRWWPPVLAFSFALAVALVHLGGELGLQNHQAENEGMSGDQKRECTGTRSSSSLDLCSTKQIFLE